MEPTGNVHPMSRLPLSFCTAAAFSEQRCRVRARHITCPTCHRATPSIVRFYVFARVPAWPERRGALHPASVLRVTGANLLRMHVGSLSCVLARRHLGERRLLLDDHLRGGRGRAGLGHRVFLQLHPKGGGGVLQLSPVLHKAAGL